MEELRILDKPEGYVSHRIVCDPHPILVINLDYTVFQAHMKLGEEYEEFEVVDLGEHLSIIQL